jgi:hypothetical protein
MSKKSEKPDISVGKTYKMQHQRFGTAVVVVTGIPDRTWVDTKIQSGVLHGMNSDWGPGDIKTVRREFCTFTPCYA